MDCSQRELGSEDTADFLKTLKGVLESVAPNADLYIIGLSDNRERQGDQRDKLEAELRNSGFEFADQPGAQQMTVAQQRSMFCTEAKNAGRTWVVRQSYILSWHRRCATTGDGVLTEREAARATGAKHALGRGTTIFKPDITSDYGIDRKSGGPIRMPTTQWPFEYAAVAASFGEHTSPLDAKHVFLENLATCAAKSAAPARRCALGAAGLVLGFTPLFVGGELRGGAALFLLIKGGLQLAVTEATWSGATLAEVVFFRA